MVEGALQGNAMHFPCVEVVALYSFSHSVISKTQADHAGKAAARGLYIVRPQAATAVLHARLDVADLSRKELLRYGAAREALAGRNGRIAESIIVALPLEADHRQRCLLVNALCETLTQRQAPFLAAVHDGPADSDNPHAHLLLFDQNLERKPGARGRPAKVMGFSREGALEEARATWAEIHNSMMRRWGYGAGSAIDHRSLAAQGSDRIPTLHEGPKARAMSRRGRRPESRPTTTRRGRAVDWPSIDEGQTREETNALVREINALSIARKEQSDAERSCRISPAHPRPARQAPQGFLAEHGDDAAASCRDPGVNQVTHRSGIASSGSGDVGRGPGSPTGRDSIAVVPASSSPLVAAPARFNRLRPRRHRAPDWAPRWSYRPRLLRDLRDNLLHVAAQYSARAIRAVSDFVALFADASQPRQPKARTKLWSTLLADRTAERWERRLER